MYTIRDIQHHLWIQSLSFIKSKSITYHISFRLGQKTKYIIKPSKKCQSYKYGRCKINLVFNKFLCAHVYRINIILLKQKEKFCWIRWASDFSNRQFKGSNFSMKAEYYRILFLGVYNLVISTWNLGWPVP